MLLRFFIVFLLFHLSNSVSINELFPFGLEQSDNIMNPNNLTEGPFNLPYVFPYFDNNYREISIANNGLFSFSQLNNIWNPSPLNSYNQSSIIAGFWTLFNINFDNGTDSGVYYQIYNNRNMTNSTKKVFDKTQEYIRNYFPSERLFIPKLAVIGTWYYNSFTNWNNVNQLNNTFQIVLCTDEDRSFVFFLYHDLQWHNPYNYSGHNVQAGFHNVESNKTVQLPYSGTNDILKLVNQSNVNVPGLFAFRIDGDEIAAAGCNNNLSTVSFRPRIVSQFGSTPLIIYGPCFTNRTVVKCQFGSSSESVTGFVIDKFRALCLTPFGSFQGPVSLNISIIDTYNYSLISTLNYAPIRFGSDEVKIERNGSDTLINPGEFINFSWTFSDLLKEIFPNGTLFDIHLWKISHSGSQLQTDNSSLTIKNNISSLNSILIQLPLDISHISSCFIRIIARFNSKIYAGLNTGLLFIKVNPSLAKELCQNWVKQQPDPSEWNGDRLLQCPMTNWQAYLASRCCYQRDQQCYKGNSDRYNCWLHKARSGHDESSAVECYNSIISNNFGAGAECCYDINGTIITRGTGAGTDDRYHPILYPYQHFLFDKLPYMQCCLMSNDDQSCENYMRYRPARRGSNTMGESGRMWGDPHFGTLDGFSYTFNGYGEYIYLAIVNNNSISSVFSENEQDYLFMSQIRTTPLQSKGVTITKGFAAKSNDADAKRISFTISNRQQVRIHRGDEFLEFEDNKQTYIFPELTLTRIDDRNNTGFLLTWNIGIVIEINVTKLTNPLEEKLLIIAAFISSEFREKTFGLLGTYDGNKTNDLRNRNGTILRDNATLEQIHKEFGVTWAINPSKSLFFYELNENAAFFQQKNQNFNASFTDPSLENNTRNQTLCGIVLASPNSPLNAAQRTCYYDLSLTNDTDFAKRSFQSGSEFLYMKENRNFPPVFDSLLPLKMDIKQGNSVTLNVSAISPYKSHQIDLIELHRPNNSQFNATNGLFTWIALAGDHYISIEARDRNNSAKSKHDITFKVTPTNSGSFKTIHFTLIILFISFISWL